MESEKNTMLEHANHGDPSGDKSKHSTTPLLNSTGSVNATGKKLGNCMDGFSKNSLTVSEKLNGELDACEKNKKKNCVSKTGNRARSRSKSPRGKSPDKKDSQSKTPEKKIAKASDKKDTSNKYLNKSPNKKSPNKCTQMSKNPVNKQSSPKKKSPKQVGATDNKDNKKQLTNKAKKRKVKDESVCAEEEDQIVEPKLKKSKNDSEEQSPNKPKRKYTKKIKKGESSKTAEGMNNANDEAKNTPISDDVGHSNVTEVKLQNAFVKSNTGNKETSVSLPNGVLAEKEIIHLQGSQGSTLKKNNKKVNKKQSKSEMSLPPLQHTVSKPNLPVDIKLNHASGELEDSDTMDYSVNNGGGNPTDNLVEKKVVKIDDIEITELSDLNSSRESGDENYLDHCLVEKPQALNDNASSPQTGTTVTTGVNIAKGVETDGEKLFICEQEGCKYRGKSKVLLRKHLTHHGIYNCAHCDFLGHQYNDLETHMVANHPQRWGRKKCKKCTRYIRGDQFESHDQNCEGKKMFSCEICGKEFKYESLARDHEKKMHRSHNCQFCDFIGDTKQILSHHMSQVHPKKKPDRHKCKQCEELFSSKKLLTEHNKTVHGTVLKMDTETDVLKGQSFASTDPNPLNSQDTTITDAIKSENQKGDINLQNVEQSNNTSREALSVANIVQQQIPVSEETVNVPHETADANVSNEYPTPGSPPDITIQVPGMIPSSVTLDSNTSDVNTDYEEINTKKEGPNLPSMPITVPAQTQQKPVPILPKNIMEERPFACEKCPKRFKDQKTLNSHQNVHNKELKFKCDIEECKLAFKTARLLQFHKNTVHDVAPGVPMYPCDHPDCHLVFKKKGQLKKHEVVHTGERRYVCEWPNCGKAFRHNANLKIHHLLHTGEKPIKCSYCDFACRQKSSLIHHMKTKHKEIGWPPPKKDVPDLPSQKNPIENANDSMNENKDTESHDDSKSELDISLDRISETDISGNSEPPKLESVEAPVYPKMLSTPTKAMVKAMAPGFRLNTPGFEKMKPISPINAGLPPPVLSKTSHTDVYDFNDDDNDSGIPVALPKKYEKGQVKSPGRPPLPAVSNLELLQAMEPMNLSTENRPIPEEVKVVKKKRISPKKKKEESINSDKSDIGDTSIDTSMDTSVDQSFDTTRDEEQCSVPVTPEKVMPIIPENDSDSGVRSQESLDHGSSDSIVEEHVSENVPPMSVTSSAESVPQHNEEEETEMEQQPVAVPSQPEPYPDPDLPIQQEEQQHHHEPTDQDESYQDQERQQQTMDDSTISDIPPDVEELALRRPVDPGSPGLLDMHLSEKRDGSSHSFDLPHDIDPDEAAKLLEESDSFHEDPKNTSGSHEVPVIMSNSQSNKEDYLPPSPSSHNNSIHHEQEQRDINNGQYDYTSYGQHHPGDFDQIHDLSSHDKDRTEPESYSDPSQRRPSSSYVPDFLPTMATTSAGSSGMGPPSVSSSYSSPSYSVPSQNPADLPTYGAPGSNLPPYPPQSSSVPYLSPNSTHTTYPTTTSAGSGIASYPAVTTTSFTESESSERVPSVADTRPGAYRDTETTTVTSSSSYPGAAYHQSSRDLFGHYLQDPNLPLSHIASQQDPRSLTYPSQQSSLQALQRSSADFLQRASAGGLPGMNYPSVTESLARLSQTTTQQPWIGHDERSRPWAQASPIIMPPDLDTASSLNRNPFSSTRPEYSSLDSAAKRAEPAFPTVPSQSVPSASERYDVASAYMGGPGPFNPTSNYSKGLPPSVTAPAKQLEEAYRHSAATHMSDYRTLSQGPPSVTDMYSRMGMNPTLGLDKYYGYSRDAMYRSQHIGSTPNPFMPQTSSAQMPYADRDYAARNPYAQDSAYSKYLPAGNLTQPLPGLQGAPTDYFQARPGAPDPYDPYRRSVIHNMMTRYF